MSVRFKGDHIEDKQGNVLNLSYEDLLKECLSSADLRKHLSRRKQPSNLSTAS